MLTARKLAYPGTVEKVVLNVGGGDVDVPIPEHFRGWVHKRLDIDPKREPEILLDARRLGSLDAETFDAIYCSHNLEHYFRHDVHVVLAGFLHVLKPDGFAQIIVPDLQRVAECMIEDGKDIDDVAYQSAVGPITFRDVIFGYEREIEESGNDFYAHKTGFTPRSLKSILMQVGFADVEVEAVPQAVEVHAVGFKR